MSEQIIMDIKFDPRNTPRPPIGHPVFVRKGVESILPDVKAWLVECNDSDEILISDLTDAYNASYAADGYSLARYLEDHYWCANRELVDILDELDTYVGYHRSDAVRIWVKTADLKYPEIGSRVKSGNLVGTVEDIDTEFGKCYIRKDGETEKRVYLFDVEKVEVL